MNKREVIARLVGKPGAPARETSSAYAPVNIALCKYWGKRDEELNLPLTSSLSVALPSKGTRVQIERSGNRDAITVNGQAVPHDAPMAARLIAFLDLFRPAGLRFRVATESNIPIAAGLASSASVFASLVKALDGWFQWKLDGRALSILARMGSGSASRSIFDGFVEWHVGIAEDGMDSFAEPLAATWPALRMGFLMLSTEVKAVGSRAAMKRTKETSALYEAWPVKVADDLVELKEAVREKDFDRLGETSESNALAMHATMMASRPPILYWLPESVAAMHRVWRLRVEGLPLYFTMDAGPNLKLLFEEPETAAVTAAFPGVEVLAPFEG